MTTGVRVAVLTIVSLAHVVLLYLLAQAMRPPPPATPLEHETVLILEFFDPPPDPEPEPEPETEAEAETEDQADPEPPAMVPPPRRASSAPMRAVFETVPPAPPEPARERISPEQDPFSRPSRPPVEQGFGRRDQARLPEVRRPRISGEATPNAPLRGLRAQPAWDARRIVETVGSLIAGGPNAPIELPCGSRINAGQQMTEAFSPHWQRDHQCNPDRDEDRYDGRAVLPPGSTD